MDLQTPGKAVRNMSDGHLDESHGTRHGEQWTDLESILICKTDNTCWKIQCAETKKTEESRMTSKDFMWVTRRMGMQFTEMRNTERNWRTDGYTRVESRADISCWFYFISLFSSISSPSFLMKQIHQFFPL